MGDVSIDMEHRDPNDLNYHVKVNIIFFILYMIFTNIFLLMCNID